jgi:transcriptional regulator with XRE-family HTH domain
VVDESDLISRNLGLKVVALRRARRITQERLAEQLSMDTRDLRRIEAGDANVTVRTLVRMARALEVEVNELFLAPTTRPRRSPGRPKTSG